MKAILNYAVDALMLVAFAACGLTGIAKLPQLAIEFDLTAYGVLSAVHDWSGVAGMILVAAHLALHATWISAMTKRLFAPKRRKAAPKAAVALLAAAFALTGGQALHAHGPSRATVPEGITYPAGTLKDGTYTGSATGYMPSLQVSVTVKNGNIQSISVDRHGEGARWYNAVIAVLPGRIVKAQSTDVDGVTGATSTTHGILSAVENALAKAAK
jgi:uncharacterized protein with FMN-binding domain